MTADLFFNYVIPVILIVNVIAVISLGVDYFRDRKSNLKKNLDEFKAASLELCDNLERFHDDTKKISAEIFEAVSSIRFLNRLPSRTMPRLTARISCMSHTTSFGPASGNRQQSGRAIISFCPILLTGAVATARASSDSSTIS